MLRELYNRTDLARSVGHNYDDGRESPPPSATPALNRYRKVDEDEEDYYDGDDPDYGSARKRGKRLCQI